MVVGAPTSVFGCAFPLFSLNFCEGLVFFSFVKVGIFKFGMGLRGVNGAKGRN